MNQKIIIDKKDINKIVRKNEAFINELNFFTKINNNYKDYFYIFKSCTPLKMGLYDNNSKFIDEIEHVKTYNQYLLKYDNLTYINLINHINKNINNKIELHKIIIKMYPQILNCILKLEELSILHNNINMDNIMVKITNKTDYLLSNFQNASIDINDHMNIIHKNNLLYKIYLPPEVHVLYYMYSNKIHSLSEYNIENIIDNLYFEKNKILPIFESNIQKSHKLYFNKYVNKSYIEIKKDIYKYSTTWDNYIFHFNLLIFIKKYKLINDECFNELLKLIKYNLVQIPSNRLSNKNNIITYNDFIENIDYNKLINLFSGFSRLS